MLLSAEAERREELVRHRICSLLIATALQYTHQRPEQLAKAHG